MNVTKLLYKLFLTPEVEIVAADCMASGRVSCSGSLSSMRRCSGMITGRTRRGCIVAEPVPAPIRRRYGILDTEI